MFTELKNTTIQLVSQPQVGGRNDFEGLRIESLRDFEDYLELNDIEFGRFV